MGNRLAPGCCCITPSSSSSSSSSSMTCYCNDYYAGFILFTATFANLPAVYVSRRHGGGVGGVAVEVLDLDGLNGSYSYGYNSLPDCSGIERDAPCGLSSGLPAACVYSTPITVNLYDTSGVLTNSIPSTADIRLRLVSDAAKLGPRVAMTYMSGLQGFNTVDEPSCTILGLQYGSPIILTPQLTNGGSNGSPAAPVYFDLDIRFEIV